MARYDVHAVDQGWVVVVQSDHASTKVRTRIVAPLVPCAEFGALVAGLTPVVDVAGVPHVVSVLSLATLTLSELGPVHGSIAFWQGEIARALDIALTGF